jgi:NitT/TauT family transport system ATP-binding protein
MNMATKLNAIEIDDVSLTFQTNDGPVQALSGVSLTIGKGEFVSFIGPSGCGKTTLLRAIADLEATTSGVIRVNGMSASEARLKRAYGYVFQAPALYPWRSVGGASSAGWSLSISRASARNSPGNCPAACSSAPPSPARSPSIPTCC